jgi:hypothetical protein
VKPVTWTRTDSDGNDVTEYAFAADQGRAQRLLVIPALFDEGNRMRRFTVEVMRRLDAAGIDSMLPDLPGTNESLANHATHSLDSWTAAMLAAINHFRATKVLAVRGGGLVLPKLIGGWHYAPVKGASQLRQLLRARIVAGREAGREETQEALLADGLVSGLELGGYHFGPDMLRQMQAALPPERAGLSVIDQDAVGGSPLWLRAEPDEDREQADALAAIISIGMAA